MKKRMMMLLLAVMMLSLIGCNKADANKKALLVVSFGTSYEDTRTKTIDAVENVFKEEFSSYDVKRAFTSQTIIDILADRDGLEVNNVTEAMEALKKEGYGTVLIQSLHVMNGAEYDDMVAVVSEFEDDFADLKIGKALLTSVEDYDQVVEGLASNFQDMDNTSAVVFMGHGTHHEANAVYATLEYKFHSMGHEHVYVGTVEGFPTFDNVLEKLKKDGINKVTLMPFMIVAGDHAENDMAGDEADSWKVMLKSEGFEVETKLIGLGENQAVRDLFINHAIQAIEGETH